MALRKLDDGPRAVSPLPELLGAAHDTRGWQRRVLAGGPARARAGRLAAVGQHVRPVDTAVHRAERGRRRVPGSRGADVERGTRLVGRHHPGGRPLVKVVLVAPFVMSTGIDLAAF